MEVAGEVLEEVASSAMPVPESALSITETCALAAGTLLLVGVWGSLTQKPPSPKRRRSSLSTSREQASRGSIKQTLRRLLLRMACVALPFLATIEIGGVRTGMVLLTAVASGLVGNSNTHSGHSMAGSVKKAVTSYRWTCLVFVLSLLYDLVWHISGTEYSSTIRGYLALAKSAILITPPLPDSLPTTSSLNAPKSSRGFSNNTNTMSPLREPDPNPSKPQRHPITSPLIATAEDTKLTLGAGLCLGVLALLLTSMTSITRYFTTAMFVLYVLSIASAAALFTIAHPSSLRKGSGLGLVTGLAICQLFGLYFEFTTGTAAISLMAVSGFAFLAAYFDRKTFAASALQKGKGHAHTHHQHSHHDHSTTESSRFTKFMLTHTEDYPLIHDILEDKESRRIVYFMSINLGFMFVQTFYALVSQSLGLLSDSIHMFFDCVGLFAGLVASIMSKWPPSESFPYGFGKVETLSGLGNGIFLMIVSVEIIWESFERFAEGAELKRLNELMLVSIAGLAVNLIGLLFIGHAHHGHDHSHGGHSHHGHSHSHANGHAHSHEHKRSHDNMLQQAASQDTHGHAHGHSNENMMGIYLHILADTMGSVAVIASTILTAYTGWPGWDPIASFIIAVLIIAASYPLVVGSARRLLLTVPYEVEYQLRDTLQEIGNVRGVVGYAVPRFWMEDGEAAAHVHEPHEPHSHTHSHTHDHTHSPALDCTHTHPEHDKPKGQKILGVIHIIAQRGADPEEVRQRVDTFLKERNMHVVIHIDKEGQGRCWCGGDKSMHNRTSSIVPGLG